MDIEQKTGYYSKREKLFRILKYVALIVLILFTVIASIAGRANISISSFDSFINYLKINPKLTEADYSGVRYSSSPDTKICMYNNQLVVFTKGILNFYNLDGIKLATFDTGCNEICDGGKYLCAYNTNSGDIHLYNYYSEIYSASADKSLARIVTGKLGGYAAVYSLNSEMYSEVFDKNFKSVFKTQKTQGSIYDCSLDRKEKKFAVIYQEQDGAFRTSRICIYDIGSGKQLMEEKYNGEISVAVGCLSDTFYCVTDKYIRFFDSSNKENAKIQISGDILRITEGDDAILVCSFSNGVTTIQLLTKDGKSKHTVNCEGKALKCIPADNKIFVMCSGKIYCSFEDGTVLSEDVHGVKDMFVLSSGDLMVCFDDKTDLLKFEKEANK